MRQVIIEKLKEIEENENVRILLAVESGSRAWGFASPDSDYDVRFIYVRKITDYLKLDPNRDVIELPISDALDINGWDLKKTLCLLWKSNPTLFEWFLSPEIYIDTPFAQSFRGLMFRYFSSKQGMYHYLSMAKKNYREYLKTDLVIAKKYFYVLRPIMACRWISEKGTPPPMKFVELAKAELPDFLKHDVDELLYLKMHAPEKKMIPRNEQLNNYLGNSIIELEAKCAECPKSYIRDHTELEQIFLQEVGYIPK